MTCASLHASATNDDVGKCDMSPVWFKNDCRCYVASDRIGDLLSHSSVSILRERQKGLSWPAYPSNDLWGYRRVVASYKDLVERTI